MRLAICTAGLALAGCGVAPSEDGTFGGDSSGAFQSDCEPKLTRAPQKVQARSVDWPVLHAAAGEDGIYVAGRFSTDTAGSDVRVSRIDDTGAELWTAQWGSALAWDDTASALLPLGEGVLVAGISGLYPSQEYPWTGTSFVRGYSAGGRVLWTWEDSSPSFGGVFGQRDGPVVSVGPDTVAVVAPVLEQGNHVGLRFVSLDRSTGVEGGRVELDTLSAEPDAAWVDEAGSVWVAATTSAASEGSVMLLWDGAGQPSIEASAGESLFRRAFFYPDGSLLALSRAPGGGDGLLQLRRYSRQLELQLEGLIAVEELANSAISDLAITAGCDDSLLIAAGRTDESPVIAVDANLEELWTTRGLGSVAVAGQELLFAGYDEELQTPAIWQMRFP